VWTENIENSPDILWDSCVTVCAHFCGYLSTWCIYTYIYPLSSSGGPQTARGSILGNINNIEFGVAILNATITDSKSGSRIIKATISNVPRTLGQFHTYCSSCRSKWCSWTFIVRLTFSNSRSCNEEAHLHPKPSLLDHCTGSWRGFQRLYTNRRYLQAWDAGGVCHR